MLHLLLAIYLLPLSPTQFLSGDGIVNGCPLLFSHHFPSKRTMLLDFVCIYFALFLWSLHVPALHFPPLHHRLCAVGRAVLRGGFSRQDSTMANESLRVTDFAGSIFHTLCLTKPLYLSIYLFIECHINYCFERKVLTFRDTVITKHYHPWNKKLVFVGFCHFSFFDKIL